MKWIALFLSALINFSASAQGAAPPAPWEFGMSRSAVSSVTEGAPYKAFSNGDLETYSASFDGHPENFQFFFRDDRLRRIGIYLYEGESSKDAGEKWLKVHSWLVANFNQVRSSGNAASNSGDAKAFLTEAIRMAESSEKTQLSPGAQPKYAHIFASFFSRVIDQHRKYLVILYFDNPAEAQ